MSNDLPPGQHGQQRTEQAVRQKDSEQTAAECRRPLSQPTAAEPNEMRNVSVNRILIGAPAVGPSGT
jgi:hypothetical protein